MSVVATVLGVLEFSTVAVTATTSGPTHSLVTSRVVVRANVSHQVLVRLAAQGAPGVRTEVLDQHGSWVAVGSGTWVAVAGGSTTGQSTYGVQCRTTVAKGSERAPGGCQLVFDLRSPDAPSPIRMTMIPAGAASAQAPTAMMTSVSSTT